MAGNRVARKTPIPARPQLTVAEQSGLLRSRSSKYTLQSIFKYGYRNKEDVSNLPANVLVVGSQDVLTNASELVGIRQGYVLDGSPGDQNDYGVDSAYDFESRQGVIENLRKWGGHLQLRYANPQTEAVSWIDLLTAMNTSFPAVFTSFWDQATELKRFCLFVNHANEVNEWSGGVGEFLSSTANSITVNGALSTSQLGFYDNAANSAKFKLLVNGVEYTYTGVSNETFTGVTPDPSAAGVAGDAVVQKPAVTAGSAIATNGSGNLSTFIFDLISTLANQMWYGSLASNNLYVSKTNNYKDVSYSTPARLPAEGALMTLDAPAVALHPEADHMYAAAGTNQWWLSEKLDQTIDVSGVATPTQVLYMARLKTSFNQTAQSQALITSFKNSIVYVSNEPIVNSFGLVKDVFTEPQVINISDPIKYDIDAYDFTGGSVFYDNYYIYVAIPANNVVRMYNVQKNYWEAPQVIPVSTFYHVINSQGQTELYGHSSSTNESYQLFTGYNDNGNPINAVAAFPYVCQQGGSPDMLKNFNQLYTEGYISANTELMVNVNYDFGGFSGTYTTLINGADPAILFNNLTQGSLGTNTLGTQPIGTILNLPFTPAVPKFRSIKTMPRKDFFEYQIVYSTNQVDAQWTILRFGPAITGAQALPVTITE